MDNRWHIVRKDGIPGGLYLEWEKFEVVVGRRVMKSENGKKVSVEVKEKTIATYNGNKKMWIRGELDLLVPVEPVDPIGPYCPAGTSRKDRSKYGSAKRGDDRKNRSKTFPGIARAFAEQWAGDARWFWEEMDMNEELFIEAEKMLLDGEEYCKNGCDNCKIKELGGFCAKERLEEWRDALK